MKLAFKCPHCKKSGISWWKRFNLRSRCDICRGEVAVSKILNAVYVCVMPLGILLVWWLDVSVGLKQLMLLVYGSCVLITGLWVVPLKKYVNEWESR